MTYRFRLAGEVPAKKNNRRTLPNGRSIPSKGYLAWHETALVQLIFQKRARHIKQPLAGRLCIDITLTHGDLRRRDGAQANVFPKALRGGNTIFPKAMALSYGTKNGRLAPRSFVQKGISYAEGGDYEREVQKLIDRELTKFWS